MSDICKEVFQPCINQTFVLQMPEAGADDPSLDVVLTEVNWPSERILRQARELGMREPFSLTFRGPLAPQLIQHRYKLHHPATGVVEVFLVPLCRDDEGMSYHAVFG